jgi:hypothetical protein
MYILFIGANLVFAQFNKAIIRSDHKKGDHKDRPYRGMQENLLGGRRNVGIRRGGRLIPGTRFGAD